MAEPKSPQHVALGEVIRNLRLDLDMSQWDLAGQASVSPNYVGGVERGEVNASIGKLIEIARVLGVQPSELLARAEQLPRWRRRR